ncbi:hypothetical protein Pfo_019374 [Paulownia fortunei]|nr:hypothetical protein Pfo_019374 [Paulownia fortunei]
MKSNYKAWCDGFVPMAVGWGGGCGGVTESVAVQEFIRTLFNMRPNRALSVAKTIFYSDMRPLLGHVTVSCFIILSMKDLGPAGGGLSTSTRSSAASPSL